MTTYLNYFAYGSNMSLPRLRLRVPEARALGRATLYAHELRFHKRGRDGSGKCDAYFVGDSRTWLVGVLFEIPEAGKDTLDAIEGRGSGYEVKTVTVHLPCGGQEQAVTYYATDIDENLRPLCWYREHVLAGAREFRLPDAYRRGIESVQTIPDQDQRRRLMELQPYQ